MIHYHGTMEKHGRAEKSEISEISKNSEIFSEFSVFVLGQNWKLGNEKTCNNISEISEVPKFFIC